MNSRTKYLKFFKYLDSAPQAPTPVHPGKFELEDLMQLESLMTELLESYKPWNLWKFPKL